MKTSAVQIDPVGLPRESGNSSHRAGPDSGLSDLLRPGAQRRPRNLLSKIFSASKVGVLFRGRGSVRSKDLAKSAAARTPVQESEIIDIGASLQSYLEANPGDPHCRYQQVEIARGGRDGIFTTPDLSADLCVSRNQARITIALNGTVIFENGKEDLSTLNYVGKLTANGTYEWEPVGRNGALAEPGDVLLIAGKYLIELPVGARKSEGRDAPQDAPVHLAR